MNVTAGPKDCLDSLLKIHEKLRQAVKGPWDSLSSLEGLLGDCEKELRGLEPFLKSGAPVAASSSPKEGPPKRAEFWKPS